VINASLLALTFGLGSFFGLLVSGLVCYTNLFMRNILKSCLQCSVRLDRRTDRQPDLADGPDSAVQLDNKLSYVALALFWPGPTAHRHRQSPHLHTPNNSNSNSSKQRDPLFAPVDHELFRIFFTFFFFIFIFLLRFAFHAGYLEYLIQLARHCILNCKFLFISYFFSS